MDTGDKEFRMLADELARWIISTLRTQEYLATADRDQAGNIIAVKIAKIQQAPAPPGDDDASKSPDSDPRRAHRRDRRRTRPL